MWILCNICPSAATPNIIVGNGISLVVHKVVKNDKHCVFPETVPLELLKIIYRSASSLSHAKYMLECVYTVPVFYQCVASAFAIILSFQ